MKQGFIKARTLSPEGRVADVKFNTAKIIQAIWDSDERGVKLLVLPELCVSSATCGDLFLQRPFLDACEGAVRDIADATYEKQLVAVIGAPLRQGGRLYSCAIVICNGKILGAVPKTTLSADEKRYFCTPDGAESNILIKEISYPFSPRLIFECAQLRELKIGVEFGAELFSSSTVAHDLCARGATVIACPSAMPEVVPMICGAMLVVLMRIGRIYWNGWFRLPKPKNTSVERFHPSFLRRCLKVSVPKN